MKLASLKSGGRDGTLLVVSRDLQRAVVAGTAAPTLQSALDRWNDVAPSLDLLYRQLNNGQLEAATAFDARACAAPLPRAYQWLDGSGFPNHMRVINGAANASAPVALPAFPLMYQGASDDFIGAHDPVHLPAESDDIDFEGEAAVVLDDVPMGVPEQDALKHIKLVMLLNDISLRAYAPRESAGGFGFINAKGVTSFAPVAVTPDELGNAWRDGRIELPMRVSRNGEWFGHPGGEAMHFTFPMLIEHAARRRNLRAGTIVGSGTFSNPQREVGSATIIERRALETADAGTPHTHYLQFGETIRIEMLDSAGYSIFGAIDQKVLKSEGL
ncbi:fumarylacetoacetate hydrolase family protein [Paraburkholderia sediminicola]|uniref:fumarylacetoacetate hydrolase family protein n=1 Tax=Paraburkholderia TaxID=1822464 RepID=UPI0038B86670